MMYYKISRAEQDRARAVDLCEFLMMYDWSRFSESDSGYIFDLENPTWVGSTHANWWYDNAPNAEHKNGNIIDWLMYMSGENYTFQEAVKILLAYVDGGEWKTYLRRPKVDRFAHLKPEDMPFN